MARPASTRASDEDMAGHVGRLNDIATRWQAVNREMAALRPARSDAIRAAHDAGLTWREIAELLNLPAAQHAQRLAVLYPT